MILESEGKSAISNPKASQIRTALGSLRSYGPHSYASVTDEANNYLQVAGGGASCLLELYRANTGERFRAYGNVKNKAFPDGTLLIFRAGQIPMMADEWMKIDKVIEAFNCFLENKELPSDINWRLLPGF
ncbi:hypothetical protein [Comamonas sediminis]|uniref:hypothetical protein n=1 Tax=Comamonas sediminis TaxID=1783360 RepID=UPI0034E3EF29